MKRFWALRHCAVNTTAAETPKKCLTYVWASALPVFTAVTEKESFSRICLELEKLSDAADIPSENGWVDNGNEERIALALIDAKFWPIKGRGRGRKIESLCPRLLMCILVLSLALKVISEVINMF